MPDQQHQSIECTEIIDKHMLCISANNVTKIENYLLDKQDMLGYANMICNLPQVLRIEFICCDLGILINT